MNLTSLKYFVELTKELHVTNAAKTLYISQQNLTQHIKKLEDHYGIILFNRKPKLSLTYAGEVFKEFALEIISAEEKLLKKLSDIKNKEVAKLRLGILSYRAQLCIPLILEEFYKKWPNITIVTIDENSEILEKMIFSNEIDIFIGIMPKENSNLNIIPLFKDRIYLVISDALLKMHFGNSFKSLKSKFKNGTSLKAFANVPFLLQKAPSRIRTIIDNCLKIDNIKPKIFLETMSTELLLPLYPYNYGIFFCTQMRLGMLANMFNDFNAFPILSEEKFVFHKLVLAHHKNHTTKPYLMDFIEITKSVFDKIEKRMFETSV
ncbi:LysR family transcriptional regulator [Fusobacterium sp. PH5-44]|uniref:LysR family transcriptional regulator n=1 Tax=unclassified Fusobacterium TaxID=2648384 RepID=UPI003D2555C4